MLFVRQLAEITRNRLLIVIIIILVLLSVMAHDKVLLLNLERQLGCIRLLLLSQAVYLAGSYQVCLQHAVSGSIYGNWILFAFALNSACYIHLV